MVFRRYRLHQRCLYVFTLSIFAIIVLGAFYLLPGNPDRLELPDPLDGLTPRHEAFSPVVEPVPEVPDRPVKSLNNSGIVRHIVPHQSAEEEPKGPIGEVGKDDTGLDAQKRDKVVEMIKHAWNGYEKYAWGINEVRPVTKTGHTTQIFGGKSFGATIVDSLDTLFIAGLTEEYQKAKQWVENNFKFEGSYDVSVFEINIRFVGGFLSAYALTKDDVFLKQAAIVARKLLPAFDTPTGIPRAIVNIETNQARNWGWASGGCSILAEFGTLSMEFLYLSELTGDNIFRDKVTKIMTHLKSIEKEDGLYANYLNPSTGLWCMKHTSVGALGDSFYEYLFKTWRQTSHYEVEMKAAYDTAMEAILNKLRQTSVKGHQYFAEMRSGRLIHKMDHLACFIGGLIGYSAKDSPNEKEYLQIADGIGETCHVSYNSTETGLGPESFHFETEATDARALKPAEKSYLLRPEVIETYFYMWRLTHDQKWRNYGWEAVQAIEKHCRSEGGYSGIRDVYSLPAQQDDVQQSFFIAETLKYLYLLFSPDHVIPLDQYVFNTEAHPLPVFKPSLRNS